MKSSLYGMLAVTVLTVSGCSTTSKTAQTFFTPNHYDPPEIYAEGVQNNKDSLIVTDRSGDTLFLNKEHPQIEAFRNRNPMTNSEFVQVAYLYLLAAENQCEKRVADINRSRTANNSGFGMLTTLSAVAGAALGSATGANAASGAAAFFNTLNSNSDAFQTQIAAQYSGNIATVIVGKQADMIEDNNEGKSPVFGIKTKLSRLINPGMEDKLNLARQSELHYELNKFNRTCTVSAGQREIG